MGKIRPKDLENGVATLAANRYYGSDSEGNVGFHLLPGASGNTGEATFKFGENIAAGKLVFLGDGSFKERYREGVDVFNKANLLSDINFGNSSAYLRYRVKFDMPSNYEYLSSIILPITKAGSAHTTSYWIQGKIETLGGDLVKESNKPVGSKFANGFVVLDFNNIKLTPGTSYWLELVCGTTDGTNYYKLKQTAETTTGHAAGTGLVKYGYERHNGTNWVQDNEYSSIALAMNFSIKTEQGSIYECNSFMPDTCVPDGVTSEAKSAGENGKVMVVGVGTSFSNLAPGIAYKINSDLISGKRWSRSDLRFGYSTGEQKIAQLFTCDFSKPISKMALCITCSDRTVANKLVVKIVEVDENTGMPSNNLADTNAVAKIDYADFVNNKLQPIIVKFPAAFNLTINKQYYVVLEIEGSFSTTGYITARYDNSTGDGNLYRYETSAWAQKASSSLCYTFIHGDDVSRFMENFWWNIHSSNKKLLSIGDTNSRKQGFRFMVSVPTRVKALTWAYENNNTPTTDLKIRIESNKILSHKANDNGLCYTGDGGTAYDTAFGSSESMKVAMRFTPTEDQDVKTLSLWLKKTSTPSDKVTVRIETDNEGKPSGTLVSTSATDTQDQSMITGTSEYACAFQFNENIHLQKSETYWIVVSKENDEVSSTAYYNASCKNGGTYTGGEVWTSANGTDWTVKETGVVRMKFCFNNSYNESIDVPSGELVMAGAKATFPSTSHQSGVHFATVEFDQEVSLIPNTIYWLVFENFRPITDTNYYRIYCCDDGNWPVNGHQMRMPYLALALSQEMKWLTNTGGNYPRFRFDGIREDDGGTIDVVPGDWAGKEIVAISDTAGMLTTGEAGNVFKKTLTDTTTDAFGAQFVFRAPKDGQIVFLKSYSWTVKGYVFGNDYTEYSSQTGSTAGAVNIEKGKLYQISNGSSSYSQDIIISLQ